MTTLSLQGSASRLGVLDMAASSVAMGSPSAAACCDCARGFGGAYPGSGKSSSSSSLALVRSAATVRRPSLCGVVKAKCDFGALPPQALALSSSNRASFSGCQGMGWRASLLKIPFMAHSRQKIFSLRITAVNIGDFGARDPYPSELESKFGEKVLGNAGTEHIILIPSKLLGLSDRSCEPLPPETSALSEDEASALIRKVVGWRLNKSEQGLKIWTEWKLKDSEAVATLFDRISAVAEAEGQSPDLRTQGDSNVARAELSTPSLGGLSINDFIFAAKIDKIKTSDLVKKNRFWA